MLESDAHAFEIVGGLALSPLFDLAGIVWAGEVSGETTTVIASVGLGYRFADARRKHKILLDRFQTSQR